MLSHFWDIKPLTSRAHSNQIALARFGSDEAVGERAGALVRNAPPYGGANARRMVAGANAAPRAAKAAVGFCDKRAGERFSPRNLNRSFFFRAGREGAKAGWKGGSGFAARGENPRRGKKMRRMVAQKKRGVQPGPPRGGGRGAHRAFNSSFFECLRKKERYIAQARRVVARLLLSLFCGILARNRPKFFKLCA